MELSKKTKEYWHKEDWEDLKKAELIGDLHAIAVRVINRMPKPIIQVCGPISSGGLGSIEANFKNFNDTIIKLQNHGLNVFDQMPFEEPMRRLKEKLSSGKYLNNILTDFYYPLFKSGAFSALYFLPDWQTSVGAKWEHEKAKELGIEIIYL